LRLLYHIRVGVLRDLDAERLANAPDAAVHHDEAVERQHLEAIDHGLLANAGQALETLQRRPHLAVSQREIEKRLQDARGRARNSLRPLPAAVPALDRLEGVGNARIAASAVSPRFVAGSLSRLSRGDAHHLPRLRPPLLAGAAGRPKPPLRSLRAIP
jgi:hypothetical protein